MKLSQKIYSKGFRLTIGKTKFSVIIGWYSGNKVSCFHRFGILPSILKTGFEKDHLQTNSFRLWIKSFCILYYKYQHASKFGLQEAKV